MTDDQFIQERLEKLNLIDRNIVCALDHMSELFEICSRQSVSNEGNGPATKECFSAKLENVYTALSETAIALRGEVKHADENTGTFKKNIEHVMILPISVEKKNTALGTKKLSSELNYLHLAQD